MRNLKRALSLTLASVMLLGMMVVGSSAASFPDVDSDEHNIEAIDVLETVEVMIGNEKGEFEPDKPVTRAEMAVVMAKLLNYDYDYYVTSCPFTDVPDWAKGYVGACAANGIVAGRGEGIYDPNATVTAVEAAAMMMRALGYFQNSGDYSPSFEAATVRQASEISLFSGINGNANDPLDRNQVAQLALNTLEANMVSFTGEMGIEIPNVGSIGYRSEYTARTGTESKYAAISALGTTNRNDVAQYYVQLGEQLFNGDLRKNGDNDDFGRPADTWEYKTDAIGTYTNDETYTYTLGVSNKNLYDRVGSLAAGDTYDWLVYHNGKVIGDTRSSSLANLRPVRNSTDTWSQTGRGVLTQVYVDVPSKLVTVSMINVYLAEVVRVQNNKDDVTVSLSYLSPNVAGMRTRQTVVTLDSTDLAVDDKVLVTAYDDGNRCTVDTIDKADSVSGSVTAVKSRYDQNGVSGSYAVMDGDEYNYVTSATFAKDLADTSLDDPTINAENVLYLDPWGNLIGFEASERYVNYVYLEAAVDYLKGVHASAVFADGHKETIFIDEVRYLNNVTKNPTKTTANGGEFFNDGTSRPFAPGVYAYTKQDNNYQVRVLRPAHGTADSWGNAPVLYDTDHNVGYSDSGLSFNTYETVTGTPDTYNWSAYKIKNGTSSIQRTVWTGDADTDATNGTGTKGADSNVVSLTNATIFVDTEGGKAYTGFNEVPSMNDVDFYVAYTRQGNADVVFITKNADNSSSDSFFFVLDTKPVTTQPDENGSYLYTYKVIRDGEETEIVLKGTNNDVSGSQIAKGNLYKIDRINSSDQVTQASLVPGFGLSYRASADVATYAQGGTLRVQNQTYNIAKTSANFNAVTSEYLYRYDNSTQFVYIKTERNSAGASVLDEAYVGNNYQVINAINDTIVGNNNVYVAAVDDTSSIQPKATLVYVVEPVDGTFVEHSVTYTTTAANINSIAFSGDTDTAPADGRATVFTGSYNLVVTTASSRYEPEVRVNGVLTTVVPSKSGNTYTYNGIPVTGTTNIVVSARTVGGNEASSMDTIATVNAMLMNGDVIINGDWTPADAGTTVLRLQSGKTLTINSSDFNAVTKNITIAGISDSKLKVNGKLTIGQNIPFQVEADSIQFNETPNISVAGSPVPQKNITISANMKINGDATVLGTSSRGCITISEGVVVDVGGSVKKNNPATTTAVLYVYGTLRVNGQTAELEVGTNVYSPSTLEVRNGTMSGALTLGDATHAGHAIIKTQTGAVTAVNGTLEIAPAGNLSGAVTVPASADAADVAIVFASDAEVSGTAADQFVGEVAGTTFTPNTQGESTTTFGGETKDETDYAEALGAQILFWYDRASFEKCVELDERVATLITVSESENAEAWAQLNTLKEANDEEVVAAYDSDISKYVGAACFRSTQYAAWVADHPVMLMWVDNGISAVEGAAKLTVRNIIVDGAEYALTPVWERTATTGGGRSIDLLINNEDEAKNDTAMTSIATGKTVSVPFVIKDSSDKIIASFTIDAVYNGKALTRE